MEKLNFEQLTEVITELDSRKAGYEFMLTSWFREEYPEELETYIDNPHYELISKLGRFECVEHFGGTGQGDKYWTVYHFIDHDVYVKFDGWYASYHGSEFEEMLEVVPVEVTKVEYQTVPKVA